MPAPRTVFHLISTLETGGAQTLLLATLPRLDPRRFRPIVGYLWGQAEALDRRPAPPGAPPLRIIDFSRHGAFDPLAPLRVAACLRREKAGIVHTHLVHAGIVGRVAAALAGVPRIVTTRHYADDPKERTLAYRLENRMTRRCDRVIAVSACARSFLLERGIAPAAKVVLLPNGIDLDRFGGDDNGRPGAAGNPPVVGATGRLRPQKGFDILLRAFADLHRSRPGISLEIAGDGPEREPLASLARELGIAPVVRFLGAVPPDSMPATLRRWTLFVLPSRYEAFGLAALEAMAMGVPVIGARVEGLAQWIDDGVTGRLVPPGDPEAIARTAMALLDRPEEASALAARGRAWVRAHGSVQAVAEGLERIYDALP